MTEENGEKVQLYVYDLSQGLAKQLSRSLLGKQVRSFNSPSVKAPSRC